MSGPTKSRGMIQYVFKHFWNSFKVGKRQTIGQLMGRDKFDHSQPRCTLFYTQFICKF